MESTPSPLHPLAAVAFAGLMHTPRAIHPLVYPCGLCTFLVALLPAERVRFPALRHATHVRVRAWPAWPGFACVDVTPVRAVKPSDFERSPTP